jgi:hypothetical protein
MGIDLLSIWDRVSYAPTSGGAIGLLEPLQYRSLEDDSFVLNVVYL